MIATRRSPRGWPARIAAVIALLVTLPAVDAARSDEPVDALRPTPATCAGNPSFCGITLRIDSDAGTIPSVAAGAHYGPAWGIPTASNNSTGVGWCVDDRHTGFPVGPITERPLPSSWTAADMRRAATIIALYGGDDVVPYQPLRVDRSGELAGVESAGISPTRHRQIAVWFALRSLLPDAAGTPRIDLGSAATFGDPGGRRPSAIGNSAVRLARRIVGAAEEMTWTGQPTVTVRTADGQPPASFGITENVIVHVEDGEGKPLANYPVWPTATTNATVAASSVDAARPSVAFLNAEASGWPSPDSNGSLNDAAVTDADGNARFTIEVEAPGPWQIDFATAGPPAQVHLFGDGINAQNNVSILSDESIRASGFLAGDIVQHYVRVVKTSSDATFDVAGAVIALVDANRNELERGTTDDEGVINFPPVDASHPAPLAVREITPPPGLAPHAADIEVAGNDGLSSDPASPTVFEIENHPATHEVVVQKEVVGSAGFGPSLSGFTFAVTRDVDDAEFGTVTTDATGGTPPLNLPAGYYSIWEIERPERWPGDEPLPDPIAVTVPVDADEPILVTFENALSPPSLTTSATDRADGDKYVSGSGGTVVDRVTVCGAVAGTTYRVEGQIMMVASGTDEVESTGITTTTEFVAEPDDDGCQSIDVEFSIPSDSEWLERPGRLVVTQELFVDSERVATHDDVGSIEQSVFVAKVRSHAVDGADGDDWIDRDGGIVRETLAVSDLDPSRRDVELRADSTLMTVSADGDVQPTGASGTTTFKFDDIGGDGQPTVEIPYSSSDLSIDGGIGVVFTTITDVETGIVVAEHHEPQNRRQQVRWRPVPDAPPLVEPAPPPTTPLTPPGDLPRTGGDSTARLVRWGSATALIGSLLFFASGARRRTSSR